MAADGLTEKSTEPLGTINVEAVAEVSIAIGPLNVRRAAAVFPDTDVIDL